MRVDLLQPGAEPFPGRLQLQRVHDPEEALPILMIARLMIVIVAPVAFVAMTLSFFPPKRYVARFADEATN